MDTRCAQVRKVQTAQTASQLPSVPTVLRSGWLEKRGGANTAFRKRFFVLNSLGEQACYSSLFAS